MTKPKRRLPGDSHKVTRRMFDGTGFMAPADGVREIVGYLVAFAAQKTGLQLHSCAVLGNHYHHSDTDPEGRLGEYLAIFNGMMARVFNRRLAREGYFWDARGPAVQKIVRPQDHASEWLYVAANPVDAGLVPTVAEWPGFVITPAHHNRAFPLRSDGRRRTGPSSDTSCAVKFATGRQYQAFVDRDRPFEQYGGGQGTAKAGCFEREHRGCRHPS